MNIKKRLENSSLYTLAIYSTIVIFLLYTCCYAYRKPFTVGLYEGQTLWGMDIKILFVLSEIIGYALSKFIGTVILPSMKKHQRVYYVIGLLTFSELAWLGFGSLPEGLKVICVFFSGLPLGMIWGIIFSFIEGRRISEVLNVGLSTALIISSGLVKSLGQTVLNIFPISEYWMPFVTGALIYPLMLLCCYLLNQIPEPNEVDKVRRTERLPMSKSDRRQFVKQFFFGISMLMLFYGSLTVFREMRDSFAADIWKEFNVSDPMIFTKTEYPIAFIVLGLMFANVFIRNNKKALNVIFYISLAGGALTIFSTVGYIKGYLSPMWWMILSGLGMNMGYIPFTYFVERLIASLKITFTTVFLIYMADSFGYLGTVGVFLFKNFSTAELSWSTLLVYTSIIASVLSLIAMVCSYFYFKKRLPKEA